MPKIKECVRVARLIAIAACGGKLRLIAQVSSLENEESVVRRRHWGFWDKPSKRGILENEV